MSAKQPQRRRRLYWYQGFQPSFVWGLGGAVLAGLMASVFSLLILIMAHGRPVVPDIFPVLIIFNLIGLASLGIIIYWVALFVSHRMGGPLYRMSLLFEQLGQGRLDQQVNLRRDDQLQEIAQALNQGVGGLRYRLGRLRRRVDALHDSVQEADLKSEVRGLRQELDELFVF